jgi:outer membrane protein assembly factor BamE (lipoprotein component of BamABCDE complex)
MMRFQHIIIVMSIALLSGCATTNTGTTSSSTNQSSIPPSNIQKVKGLNGVDGEIVGNAAANSKFKDLKIGMSLAQIVKVLGEPSDQGDYETGKRWIPFYYGDDVRRTELVYTKQGRLTFASGSVFGSNSNGGILIRIIHNSNESGSR